MSSSSLITFICHGTKVTGGHAVLEVRFGGVSVSAALGMSVGVAACSLIENDKPVGPPVLIPCPARSTLSK